jgi:uncharacterized protein YciI
MATKQKADPQALRRLGGGRWQTRDERFTVEPESGTWVVVDAEATDELGLPLVRGPFRSLTDAKAAMEAARSGGVVSSPLQERIEEVKRRPAAAGRAASTQKGMMPSRRKAAPETPAEPPKPEIPEGLSIEPVWVVEVPYTRDAARRRPAVRHEHLERIARLLAEGTLIEAGGYSDFTSAVLIVRAATGEEAMALFQDDVYFRSGVWREPIRARPYGRVTRTAVT